MNIINGGAHADNDLKIQEFMIRPDSATNFMDAMHKCFVVIQNLKKILQSKNFLTNVGDEGGFAPSINSNEEALDLVVDAIEKSRFIPGKDISICLDVAGNELINDQGKYSLSSATYVTVDQGIEYYKNLVSKYPIKSIEDPFAEDDWRSWQSFTELAPKKLQVLGDDLLTTNLLRLNRAISEKSANAILIKANQNGLVTSTLNVLKQARANNFNTVVSARSGETEDSWLADLATGWRAGQIKVGSTHGSERNAKWNRLLELEATEESVFANPFN